MATPGGPTEDEREEGNARTPLEALSHGDFEAVMVAAAGYYEREPLATFVLPEGPSSVRVYPFGPQLR